MKLEGLCHETKKNFINARNMVGFDARWLQYSHGGTITYHHLHLRHVFTLCLGVASIFLSQTVYPEAGSCATWHPENTGETRDAAVPVEFGYNCIKTWRYRVYCLRSLNSTSIVKSRQCMAKKMYGQVLHDFTIPRWHQTSQWNMTQTQEKRNKHISLKFLLRWSCDVYTQLFLLHI